MQKMKWVPGSKSQEGQESFVLNILNEKKHGTYVEVGAFHATEVSNTYILEKDYLWSGVALELYSIRSDPYNRQRKNPCLNEDATTFNFKEYFDRNNWPKQIDYLQIDIDPAQSTLDVLLKMPMDYRYSIITFEHDRYENPPINEKYQEAAYDFLAKHGYKRVVKNIHNLEDWYVDPNFVDCDFLGSDLCLEDLFEGSF